MNPHHFVIAMDSFKGSVSSIEAGRIVASAIRDVFPDSETQIFPLADGGEGTVDALTTGLAGEIVRLDATGPLGEKIPSRFGLLPAQKTAVIEMADAAGLPSVPAEKRTARFRCCMAMTYPSSWKNRPEDIVVSGAWEGSIADAPSGSNGFGYDPLFLDPASGRTGAELSREEKMARSHRGKALARLLEELEKRGNLR